MANLAIILLTLVNVWLVSKWNKATVTDKKLIRTEFNLEKAENAGRTLAKVNVVLSKKVKELNELIEDSIKTGHLSSTAYALWWMHKDEDSESSDSDDVSDGEATDVAKVGEESVRVSDSD